MRYQALDQFFPDMFELLKAFICCTSLETAYQMADEGLEVLDCFLHFLLFYANLSSWAFKFGLMVVSDLLQRDLDAQEELRSGSKSHPSQKFEKEHQIGQTSAAKAMPCQSFGKDRRKR